MNGCTEPWCTHHHNTKTESGMTNKELQQLLQKFPDDMKVKLYFKSGLKDFENENVCDHAPDDYLSERGYLQRGAQERVLIINPPIQ